MALSTACACRATATRVSVEDLARALALVADEGVPGEADDAAEPRTAWLDRIVERAPDADGERVHASARESGRGDLSPMDFPLYAPVPVVGGLSDRAASRGALRRCRTIYRPPTRQSARDDHR